jgi:asparagine synthase (glutamine-hydrolysing)
LTLARDRIGEKPLYFGRAGSALVFASELKALRAAPGFQAEIEPASVAAFLRFGYVPGPASIWRDVHKLAPGTYLKFRQPSESPLPQTYWSLGDVVKRGQAAQLSGGWNAICDKTETVLADVVESQLISDVPVGVFLSGGIDSSLVTALACSRCLTQVRTFSIGFEKAGFDESHYARAVAAHLGTYHTELKVTESDALSVIPELPTIYDEPFADSSQIPTTMLSRLTREYVTVALSGDGGDEIFGGYNRHVEGPALARRLNCLPSIVRRTAGWSARIMDREWLRQIIRPVSQQIGLPRTTADRLRLISELMSGQSEALEVAIALTSLNWRPGDLTGADCNAVSIRRAWRNIDGSAGDDASRLMAVDTLTYLPDDILVKVDRAAMSASLETRAPFLDRRTVEYAWQLPISAKVNGGVGKRVLREVLWRHVPKHLVERPKQGVSIPLDDWLRGRLSDWAGDLLAPATVQRAGLLDPLAVSAIWNRHRCGAEQASTRLWPILMLQAWMAADAGRQSFPPNDARGDVGAPLTSMA